MRRSVLKGYARSLRRNQTDAEAKVWRHLRSRRFQECKFRRQQPLGPYIADFCSFGRKVVIEVDGSQHIQETEKDLKKTNYFEEKGFRVIRFWDNEVLNSIEAVLRTILERLNESPSPRPSPFKGEGGNSSNN